MRRNFMVGKVRDSRAELTMTLTSESGARRSHLARSKIDQLAGT